MAVPATNIGFRNNLLNFARWTSREILIPKRPSGARLITTKSNSILTCIRPWRSGWIRIFTGLPKTKREALDVQVDVRRVPDLLIAAYLIAALCWRTLLIIETVQGFHNGSGIVAVGAIGKNVLPDAQIFLKRPSPAGMCVLAGRKSPMTPSLLANHCEFVFSCSGRQDAAVFLGHRFTET